MSKECLYHFYATGTKNQSPDDAQEPKDYSHLSDYMKLVMETLDKQGAGLEVCGVAAFTGEINTQEAYGKLIDHIRETFDLVRESIIVKSVNLIGTKEIKEES